jgi:hypothetical protein
MNPISPDCCDQLFAGLQKAMATLDEMESSSPGSDICDNLFAGLREAMATLDETELSSPPPQEGKELSDKLFAGLREAMATLDETESSSPPPQEGKELRDTAFLPLRSRSGESCCSSSGSCCSFTSSSSSRSNYSSRSCCSSGCSSSEDFYDDDAQDKYSFSEKTRPQRMIKLAENERKARLLIIPVSLWKNMRSCNCGNGCLMKEDAFFKTGALRQRLYGTEEAPTSREFQREYIFNKLRDSYLLNHHHPNTNSGVVGHRHMFFDFSDRDHPSESFNNLMCERAAKTLLGA